VPDTANRATAQAAGNLPKARAGYDRAFEERLLERTVETIVAESMLDDGVGKVLVLRTGETAAALISALASVLALSPPAAHSGDAIKQTSRSFHRKLHSQVRQATRDPQLHDFLRRTFNYTDRTRGGRA
jgi:hypothetical protein